MDHTECRQCSVGQLRQAKLVNWLGPLDAEVVLCGQSPGREEELYQQVFYGPSGRLLKALLEKVGFEVARIRFVNALRCRPPDEYKIVAADLSTCRNRICTLEDSFGMILIFAQISMLIAILALRTLAEPLRRREKLFLNFKVKDSFNSNLITQAKII